MKHLSHIRASNVELPDSFVVKATGRYYTHARVAQHMTQAALRAWATADAKMSVSIVDPFAGDGRLVVRFIEEWADAGGPDVVWRALFWDLHDEGLQAARAKVEELKLRGMVIEAEFVTGDSFQLATINERKFDVVISNPPWELLKPDSRELKEIDEEVKATYIRAMREYDLFLANAFPSSQPSRKYAGWGTNLSRVGYDICRQLLDPGGVLAIVMPASFMADDQSTVLRRQVLEQSTIHDIGYFPAEARLFGKADVATITLVVEPGRGNGVSPLLTQFDGAHDVVSTRQLELTDSFLETGGFVIPVSVGGDALAVLLRLTQDFPSWRELEGDGPAALWAGREVDETGSRGWLRADGDGPLFLKGRMIDRFVLRESPSEHVAKPDWKPTSSMAFARVAWRDVSRPSQKRRLIATAVPPGLAAGNSLGVAHFRDGNEAALRALLGVMSSLVFEFQLRCHLATGHVSLSSLRKVRLPDRAGLEALTEVAAEVEAILLEPQRCQARLEALVAARAYGLSESELRAVLNTFPKLEAAEKAAVQEAFCSLTRSARIPNHTSARLSDLDLRMVRAVPQGGNWKDIPESIPSRRLEQIRESYKRGEGSRSTYYGRLRPDMPSYTINTYFNRPGNGCHLHYGQDRVLSQREAARLQSFPDSFVFEGPQGAVNKQIGNAVPPLLAYQIAQQLGEPGCFVDLFCGAGGMGLGFQWAGWRPLVANDIEKRCLQTYARNVHDNVVPGSISEPEVQAEVVRRARAARADVDGPLWVLGGPPCQGFSTAGQRRTMEDQRNHLFWDYVKVLAELRPDGFVFENVTGLLNMEKGRVFERVQEAFRTVMPRVTAWQLSAEKYAVPQRRKRVILVGTRDRERLVAEPTVLTSSARTGDLYGGNERALSVEEALADLPPLEPGQDGSRLPYTAAPATTYQAFMRGELTCEDYLGDIQQGRRSFKTGGARGTQ